MSKFITQLFFLGAATAFLASCLAPVAGVALATGAGVGIATERKGGLGDAATDTKIKALIADKWFKYDVKTFANLNLTVDHTRVLITGIVQNPDARVQAVRLAWQVEGVTEVINEIRVGDSRSFGNHASDVWIKTRLRSELTFDKDVRAIDYAIDVVDGTVYLIGVADTQEEADYVIQIARDVPNVKQVISYIKVETGSAPNSKTHTTPISSTTTVTHIDNNSVNPDSGYVAPGSAAPPPAVESESLQPQPVQAEPLH